MDQRLAFLESQTAFVEEEVYKIEYPEIQYPMLAYTEYEAPPWAGQITYYSMDGTGRMVPLGEMAEDLPFVSLNREQHDVRIQGFGLAYGYTRLEIDQARALGQNLSTDMAEVARRVSEEELDNIFLNGRDDMGWDGLLNHGSAKRSLAPDAAATGTDTKWTAKTDREILSDCQKLIGDVWARDSRTVYMADTLLLSPTRFQLLCDTPMGNDANTTVMKFLEQNNIYTQKTKRPLNIMSVRGLETAGKTDATTTNELASEATTGSVERAIAYRNDRQTLRFHIPQPLEFEEPMRTLRGYVVPGTMRVGGLEIRLPRAFRYLDNI